MWVFKEIRDGYAIFNEGKWEAPWTRREIGNMISGIEEELELPFVRDRLEQELRAKLAEFRRAEDAFKALDSAPQVSAEPKDVRRDVPSSPVTAAPAFVQVAAPSGGEKTGYRFARVDSQKGRVQLHILDKNGQQKGEINSPDPDIYLRLLKVCTPESIGDLHAAAFFANAIRTLPNKRGKQDWSCMPGFCFVFSGIEETEQGMQAGFSSFDLWGGRARLFFRSEKELRGILLSEEAAVQRIPAYRAALRAFEALRPAVPEREVQPSALTAAPAFAQTAAPSGGKKGRYQFAGIGSTHNETYLFRDGVCIKKSGDPSVFEALLSECSPDDIGPVRAAARAARMVQELVGKGKNPLDSKKFKELLVFQGIDNDGRKPKAVFAFYNGLTGESEPSFRKTLPELQRSTADAANIEEYKAAIEALEALGNDNALSAPAVPERGAQPSAGLSKGYRRFDFRGSTESFEKIRLLETSDRGGKAYDSSDPKIFEALLRDCHPDSIGPVRAAMKVAELVQYAIDVGEDPENIMPSMVSVFAGVDSMSSGTPFARFQKYGVFFGETRGAAVRRSLAELQSGNGPLGLGESEIQAAIEVLEALGNDNAPSSRVAATKPEARRSFSQGAGAVDEPKASVQFVRVATEIKGGVHAEGAFCPAGARPSRAEKTWLTAGQIEDKIASLAEGHPDRAVYETALAEVEQRNKELGAVPVRVMMDEFRPR